MNSVRKKHEKNETKANGFKERAKSNMKSQKVYNN